MSNLSRLTKPCLYTHVHVCLWFSCKPILIVFTSFIIVLGLLSNGHSVIPNQPCWTLLIQLRGCIRGLFLSHGMLTLLFVRYQLRLSSSQKSSCHLPKARSTFGKIVLSVLLQGGQNPRRRNPWQIVLPHPYRHISWNLSHHLS